MPIPIEDLEEAAGLFEGETPRALNRAFRELFALGDKELPLSELLTPVPENPGRFEARRLTPAEPPLFLKGLRLPLSEGLSLVVVWEKELPHLSTGETATALARAASEIAHELNNPLGGILLYSNLLREDLPPESPLLQYVEKIVKLATRARIIVKTLLNFGEIEEGPREPVEINTLLKEMYEIVADYRVLRHVRPVWELSPTPLYTLGIRTRLEQVILNLLINAGEAMGGKGKLHLRSGRKDHRIFFEVQDTGPGIPPEILPRIFEPFFTTKREGKGTGLGLAISQSIVKQHGGHLEAHNPPEGGALFRVWLPELAENES
ncbi:HAMP domain-containing histidine kinase [Thermosulfurimonas marina]|uniref:histidine kinase n=1 Tax=Thermosulfurimonas marina TaxID=2047767 RepID=A0A6H1WTY0_9BACT|nr:HAMP domain-containing sensor histidine kinase [Thermosulfurimonas marina]QJA06657.1 HAMP domain-containing histidine kinase [Thermosulfurimonas marina]